MKIPLKEIVFHPLQTLNSYKELRYLVAGTISEVIEYVSFLLLLTAMPHFLYVANSISFGLGVISGFILHKTWSFRGEQQFKTHFQFVGYVSLAAINFVLINLLLGLLVRHWHLHPALGKLIAIAFTVTWTFAISNLLIFRHQRKPTDSA